MHSLSVLFNEASLEYMHSLSVLFNEASLEYIVKGNNVCEHARYVLTL